MDEIKDTGVEVGIELPKKRKAQEKAPEKCFVGADTPYETVVQWDAEGKQVFFTEEVGEMPKEILDKLSRLTLIKYQQAIEIRDRLSKEDPEFTKINRSLKISQSGYASPTDIAFGNKAKQGMVTRLVREDRVGYWENKGYVMARPEHMADAKMRNVEGHYEHGTIGAPKEYLMVTSEENRDSLMAMRDDRRKALDLQQELDAAKKSKAAGATDI